MLTADDFGLSLGVNEAIEQAHRDGILGATSLMVAGPAAADAIARARRLPHLRVGLHLVLVEGPAVLPYERIPHLVDRDGWFSSRQTRLGVRYFFSAVARRELAAEVRAQFAAFAATGLTLEHVDAHKHMHLHPTIARLIIQIGREFGLKAVRVPLEPPAVLARCGTAAGLAGGLLPLWVKTLRARVRRAGLKAPDAVFGIAWSGQMTAERIKRLARFLPSGLSELYFHPAAERNALLEALMPKYRQQDELATLLDPGVARALGSAGKILPGYG